MGIDIPGLIEALSGLPGWVLALTGLYLLGARLSRRRGLAKIAKFRDEILYLHQHPPLAAEPFVKWAFRVREVIGNAFDWIGRKYDTALAFSLIGATELPEEMPTDWLRYRETLMGVLERVDRRLLEVSEKYRREWWRL